MNYQELTREAHNHECFARLKADADKKNLAILQERQLFLDKREGIGVGDFVLDGDRTFRVAHDWGDRVQLTDGIYGASFYLGSGYVEFSGGLNPSIDKERFLSTNERKEGAVWFFSEDWAEAHNGYYTQATFRVWKLA